MPSSPSKKILVTPLDWGLGHATRCIPIINELISQGCEVQVASSGNALQLLNEEFAGLKFHELVSYNPEYSSTLPFMLKIILQVPKFLIAIDKEHSQVANIVLKEKIDIIISDNRYGCWSSTVKSVFITHQVNIILNRPAKWLTRTVNYFVHRQIKKFAACWVPDFENGITGKLTELKNFPIRFIGMLSRLEATQSEIRYNVSAIISGPEPQRSLFEALLRKQLQSLGLKYFIARGYFGKDILVEPNVANHLTSHQMNELIVASELIICRSGYSSIMDLWKLKKKVIFIPTPGQTEQEFLAEELEARGIAYYQPQQKLNLPEAIEKSKGYSGFAKSDHNSNLLRDTIKDLLNK